MWKVMELYKILSGKPGKSEHFSENIPENPVAESCFLAVTLENKFVSIM